MKDDISQVKSELFAVRIIELYKYLSGSKKEFVLSRQILRSGTSIGANISEAGYAISKKDFLSKKYIALKEAVETLYWLRLLHKTAFLPETEFNSLYKDCQELVKILVAATKSIKTKL
ncbi:four helix bundle protein [Endomicrobium proavitum]|uniref:Four helix bundle protein n=1 Tax=Endomicrobium proavitum TaxID=1408281 RepID=A0A0G3WLC4_9BACT|nr:four helix bundle protein [Endomicrobium proavitum]AKL98309.1 hypothetical protein Epro_0930 [Endomicrobium proavitum]